MSYGNPEPAGAPSWEAELQTLHERIGKRFKRPEARRRALAYLRGLLGSAERKNGWGIAGHAGDARPDGVQRLLSTYRWDEDGVRDDLRQYVVEHLGNERAVVVVNEVGFSRQGWNAAGVGRQYNRTAGRVENCQVGLFLGYVSRRGRTFLDRELYLPNDWSADWERMEKAGVPDESWYGLTKGELSRDMIDRALKAGVPFAWAAGDAACCNDRRLRQWLVQRGIAHVLAVKDGATLWPYETEDPKETGTWWPYLRAVLGLDLKEWISRGEGAQGSDPYLWLQRPLWPSMQPEQWHWLLMRGSINDPDDRAYYACFSPADVPLEELAWVANHGRISSDALEEARQEAGLGDYEVRSWSGWYRHTTLALLAHACREVTR